ncbi:cofactor-independent phosphoglycerate mutase [bacterium]|nr:cofactor-independent phosphoglycerate mutase [bacterium]
MKYILIVGDGMADYPLDELDGKTPLQAANTPNMDKLAREGIVGTAKTIPDGMLPGSDVANLAVMGYDPQRYYSGRAPLEAASMGIRLEPDETAFRCNLVTVENGIMQDYSGGHISTTEAKGLIEAVDANLGNEEIRFHPGVSYRHLMVLKNDILPTCTPPHDITDKAIEPFLPQGSGAGMLRELMFASCQVLEAHEINHQRVKQGKKPANMIWLWGYGKPIEMPTFQQRFGLSGGVISAVDLVRGIGRCAGLRSIDVPGITGYYDTNYIGKAEYALDVLKNDDFVFIHIEAPDEASHNGDLKAKIKAIEDIDEKVLGTILKHIPDNTRILLLPDHETPISTKTHASGPVPFVMWGDGIKPDDSLSYDENSAQRSQLRFEAGWKILEYFIQGQRIQISA